MIKDWLFAAQKEANFLELAFWRSPRGEFMYHLEILNLIA